MVDTKRTLAALQTLLADNTTGDISPQDVRDMLVSLWGSTSALAEGDMVAQNDSGLWVPVGGTKVEGKVPKIQADGTVAWDTGGSPRYGPRQVAYTGNSVNTNQHNLTLPISPDGSSVLLLGFGVEGTEEITSVTQTGASWSRVFRDISTGSGIEVWKAVGATGTGVTVNMSVGNFSHCAVCEIPDLVGTFVGHNTQGVAFGQGIEVTNSGDFALVLGRAGGGSGPTWTPWAPELAPIMIFGRNGMAGFMSPVSASVVFDGGAPTTRTGSIAVFT